MPEQQLLTPGDLLDANGALAQAGYATAPVRRYRRGAVRANPLRIKEWDYYCIADDTAVLALTIADNGYMGLCSATLIDLPMGWQQTRTFMTAFPMGKTRLPETSDTGDVAASGKGYSLRFENRDGFRTLSVRVENFCEGKPLSARVTLAPPTGDSMVIATPFQDRPRCFYYNQKINCLRAGGSITLGGDTHALDETVATAVLDWGRGVWTYQNTWYWSSLSGYVNGEPFGFNLGYGFGDTRAASENMLFYRGQAHKLGQVRFDIPKKADGSDDFLAPWTFSDDQNRLKLTFTPALDRAALTNLGLLKSDQHQVFGYFDGTAVTDGGETLAFTRMPGFAEKVMNRW